MTSFFVSSNLNTSLATLPSEMVIPPGMRSENLPNGDRFLIDRTRMTDYFRNVSHNIYSYYRERPRDSGILFVDGFPHLYGIAFRNIRELRCMLTVEIPSLSGPARDPILDRLLLLKELNCFIDSQADNC